MTDLTDRLEEIGGTPKAVLAPAANRYVLVWHEEGEDDVVQVRAQFFTRDGAEVGVSFLVREEAGADQQMPSITTLASGDFVVVWVTESEAGGRSVRAQMFEADGDRIGAEITVVEHLDGGIQQPGVQLLGSGGFVVTWRGHGAIPVVPGIKAQIFDANGHKVGGEFLVNDPSASDDGPPELTGTEYFSLFWNEGTVIKGQIYDFEGNRVGGTFVVSRNFDDDPERDYSTIDPTGFFGRTVRGSNEPDPPAEDEESDDPASASAQAIFAEDAPDAGLPSLDGLLTGSLVDGGLPPALSLDPTGYTGG